MKTTQRIVRLLSLALCATTLLTAQEGRESFEAAMKTARSTHQIEWEQHRDWVRTDPVPEFEGRPMDLVPRKNAATAREVFGYLPYWRYSNYQTLNYNLLTTIAYFSAEVDVNGNITNDHDWPAGGLINRAHQEGVRVVLTVTNFNRTELGLLLGSATARANLINNLVTSVQNANGDGVSIDFEGVPGSARQNLTTFMTDLTAAFHSAIPGSQVTIFTPAVDWSSAFDYFTLADVTDGLIMQGYDYHWSSAPTAGPVAPLTGGGVWGTYNVTWTVNDYLNKTFGNNNKLILAVPFYGFEWQTTSDNFGAPTVGNGSSLLFPQAVSNANQHGYQWDAASQTPYYMYNDGNWNQGWFDDSLSLSRKFDLVNQADLKGIAIWALSYDQPRQELQGAISDAFGSTAPPLKPVAFTVRNLGNGSVQVVSEPASGATGYRIYLSTDGINFDGGTDYPNATATISNLSTDSVYYVKLSAFNANGESGQTEVLGVKPDADLSRVLVVNGFDRTSGTVNTFDYIRRVGPHVAATGRAFDAASNEAVELDMINLSDYPAVVWISGEEGTTDESFSNAEQVRVAAYLDNGGSIFVSGSEIGYDLGQQGTSSDQAFYTNYLKAVFEADRVPTYNVTGMSGGIFDGLGTVSFDDGNHGSYDVDYPDSFQPAGGATRTLQYTGFNPSTFGASGIQYEGTFGQGTATGRMVYLGVGFEAFYPAANRDAIMARVLAFLDPGATGIADGETPSVADGFELAQNYPNPFNPETTIAYRLSGGVQAVKLTVVDMLGRNVATLVDVRQGAGAYTVTWDGTNRNGAPVPSGVYVYRLQVDGQSAVRKMTLVR